MHEIKSILEKYKIRECSFRSKFEMRHDNKIDALSFVIGFFNMLMQGKNTISYWAGEIFKLNGNLISPQALQSKLQFRHVGFARQFLKDIVREMLLGESLVQVENSILNKFNRILVEDSTCISLRDEMFDFFPGTVNQKGASSTARIQLCLELKSGEYQNCELLSYRNNDQSYSGNILDRLKADDLIIRDLGYWSLKNFRKIFEASAFLITRYHFKTYVYNPADGKKIEFFKKLRSARRKGINLSEMNILAGLEEQLPCRLIAIRTPKKVEENRRRKMRKDKLEKRSKDYLEMLGWTIYLTNVPKEQLTHEEIHQLYGFRWRIEIMFKCWKSKFNLYSFFNKKKKMQAPRIYIAFYLTLIWLTLFFVRKYNFYLIQVYKRKNQILSLFKFADFMKLNFGKLENEKQVDKNIEYLARYCSQQKRKIKSSAELIYLLNFN